MTRPQPQCSVARDGRARGDVRPRGKSRPTAAPAGGAAATERPASPPAPFEGLRRGAGRSGRRPWSIPTRRSAREMAPEPERIAVCRGPTAVGPGPRGEARARPSTIPRRAKRATAPTPPGAVSRTPPARPGPHGLMPAAGPGGGIGTPGPACPLGRADFRPASTRLARRVRQPEGGGTGPFPASSRPSPSASRQ